MTISEFVRSYDNAENLRGQKLWDTMQNRARDLGISATTNQLAYAFYAGRAKSKKKVVKARSNGRNRAMTVSTPVSTTVTHRTFSAFQRDLDTLRKQIQEIRTILS